MTASIAPLPADHPLPALLRRHHRVLVAGAPGSGKTTLAAAAAARLAHSGFPCRCLSADPGLPGVGPPGAVALGAWNGDHWRLETLAALCSLDAARFRLPLVEAVRRLAAACPDGSLLIDAPGVVRGAGAAELLTALAGACGLGAVLFLSPAEEAPPLADECRALGIPVARLAPAAEARHPGKWLRKQRRTADWDAWLAAAGELELALDALALLGTPPPRHATEAWRGRQVGLLDARGATLTLGEVVALENDRLRLRAPAFDGEAATLVIRDAHRDGEGRLATAPPFRHPPPAAPPPELTTPLPASPGADAPPVIPLDTAVATLVNGVFGDPLLHLRLRQQRRSLLFDLGDPGRLPARLAHRVSDVFISHAHFDHIGGFLWLLRSRIGDYPPCRLYGPPGLAGHIAHLVGGVLWDRVEEKAPRFEVAELRGERLERCRIVAGREAPEPLPSRPAPEGVLYAELGFRVRATTLDHGTPVLAFAFEPTTRARVRKARLAARGWPAGPWLGELKRRALAGQDDAEVRLPSGERRRAGDLAAELIELDPGQRLVYATDLGDTAANRRRLTALARGAHTLVCEAPFLSREAEQAAATGHLTARACAEIATAAGVERLVPFHFSRRHAGEARALYDELRAHCRRPALGAPPAD